MVISFWGSRRDGTLGFTAWCTRGVIVQGESKGQDLLIVTMVTRGFPRKTSLAPLLFRGYIYPSSPQGRIFHVFFLFSKKLSLFPSPLSSRGSRVCFVFAFRPGTSFSYFFRCLDKVSFLLLFLFTLPHMKSIGCRTAVLWSRMFVRLSCRGFHFM